MTVTVSISFDGLYRPAHFEAATVCLATGKAIAAISAGMPDAEKARRWISEAARRLQSPDCASAGCSNTYMSVRVRRRPHDPFLDSVTANLPHCPGLDYSETARAAIAKAKGE
jgi:hypothetical protein